MSPHRLHPRRATVRRVAALLATVAGAACRGDAPPPRVDSARVEQPVPVDSAVQVPDSSGWNPSAGPVLLAPGSTPGEAIVFLGRRSGDSASAPLDSSAVGDGTVTLFGRNAVPFTATLERPTGGEVSACRTWRLRNLRSGGEGSWSVGFLGAQVEPVALDSVDQLSARDSSALVAEASRLASAVTASTSPSFQGLRFTAHEIHRFEVAPGVQALAAHLIRKVNQEADPKEEQTLLIAERDSGVTSGPYQLAYAERWHGSEEEISTSEVVAAMRLAGTSQPTLIVAREGEEGLAYSWLERAGARRWTLRWTSAYARCGS